MRLILLLILMSFSTFAQDSYRDLVQEILPEIDLPNAEYQILQRDLRLNSLIIESVKEIQLQGGEIKDIDLAASNLKRTMTLATNARTVQLGERLSRGMMDILETSIHPTKVKDHIRKFLTFFKADLAKKGVNLSSYTRRFGIQVGLFYLAAMQVDYTLPLILMSTGYAHIGAPLFLLPFSSTTTALYASARSVARYRFLLNKLGIKGTADHYKIFRSVKKYFDRSFFGTDHLVDINIQGVRTVVTLEESGLFSRILNKLGYRESLNYNNLVAFLRENALYSELLAELNPQNQSAKLALTLSILREIEANGDVETLARLKQRFHTKLNNISGIGRLDAQKNWYARLASSQNIDDVMKTLTTIPDNIAPHTFAKVWKEFILPEMSKNFGRYTSFNTYRSFRKLYDIFDQNLGPDLLTDNSNTINSAMKLRIQDYVFEAFGPLGSCERIYLGPYRP